MTAYRGVSRALGRYLKLPPVNANYDIDAGTLPAQLYMPKDQVDAVNLELKNQKPQASVTVMTHVGLAHDARA